MGQLIAKTILPGPEQMALDVLLLEQSFEEQNSFPSLRFYEWDGNWLSIGRNQKEVPKS